MEIVKPENSKVINVSEYTFCFIKKIKSLKGKAEYSTSATVWFFFFFFLASFGLFDYQVYILTKTQRHTWLGKIMFYNCTIIVLCYLTSALGSNREIRSKTKKCTTQDIHVNQKPNNNDQRSI